MKVRFNITLISALLWSLSLVTIIPGAVSEVSTWRALYFNLGSVQVQNDWMLFGFAYLGIVMIGLIVVWTGYRKRERWAWFVMLIILLCFDFPATWLPVFLKIHAENARWSNLLDLLGTLREAGWWHCLTTVPSPNETVGIECFAVSTLMGLIRSLVMSFALLLPVKAFFWNRNSLGMGQGHSEVDVSGE